MIRIALLLLLLVLTAYATASAQSTPTPTPPPEATAQPLPVPTAQFLFPEVIAEYPHDTDAFTQGLLLYDGVFYESTGLYGQSDLRRVTVATGEVEQIVPVSEEFFAEGLALVDDQLIQLTWQGNTAFVYDRETFDLVDTYTYDTEGWGLCYDGEALYMSDGSTNLYMRDPQTFELLETISVTLNGASVSNLNELECVGDDVWANVWLTDTIYRIDKTTGVVTGVVDATGLLDEDTVANLGVGAVLNGIAYNEDDETFYITGKLWPSLFEVRFVPLEE